MTSILVLPEQLQAEMEKLARRDYPRECCGLLLGREREDSRHVVLYQHPSRNLAGDDHRYEIAPGDYLKVENAAKLAGIAIIGVWHSHPDHPARPSPTDQATAWRGWSYLIVSVNGGKVADLRSWRLYGPDFLEEEIHHA